VQGVLHTYPWAFWENIILSPGEHFAQANISPRWLIDFVNYMV